MLIYASRFVFMLLSLLSVFLPLRQLVFVNEKWFSADFPGKIKVYHYYKNILNIQVADHDGPTLELLCYHQKTSIK